MRKRIAGICRFCGCTENAPCHSAVERPGLGLVMTPSGPIWLCGWIDQDQDVCSSPACVERAYRAAVERTEARAA